MSNTNFCPKCGNFLYPAVISDQLRDCCGNCEYNEVAKSTVVFRMNLKAPLNPVDALHHVDDLPVTKSLNCPRCNGNEIKFFQVVDPNKIMMNSKGKGVMDETMAAAAKAKAKGKSVMVEEDDAPLPFIPLSDHGEPPCKTPPSTLRFICCKFGCHHEWEDPARIE